MVSLMTLDKALTAVSSKLDREVLIKIDVQGYEDRVIKGGGRIFEIGKACILEINIEHLYAGQANIKDIMLMLYDCGYKYIGNLKQTYNQNGHVIFLDAVFLNTRS